MRKVCCAILFCLIATTGCGARSAPPAAAVAAAPTAIAVPAITPDGSFRDTPCWRAVPHDLEARCGYVTVPEKRAAEHGKTIRLAVMILRQKDTAPRGEPTLLLAGGPGQDAIGLFADLLGYWDHFRSEGYPKAEVEGQLRDWLELRAAMDLYVSDMAEREFVVFDQRGTGYSEPSLKCHGEAYDDCYQRLKQAGVDLSAYNTVENAADVDAVRRALGYPRVNLMGGSYGTRLGYEVLRRYGDSVRAVVFDSALPPEVDWYTETVEHYAGNLDVLFDHCAADAACGKAYANLKNEFYDLVERLDAEPLPVPGGGHFDGADLLELTWDAMYDVGKIRWLPALIHQTYQKDYRILERWGQTVGREDAGEVMAWGMSYSVECAEQWSAETWRATLEAAARLPRAIAADAVEQFAHMEDVCAVWKVPTLPVHESLKSDVPALFLSGEFDPATPPALAEASAANFTRAYRYVFPGMGHTDGFFSRCWTSIQFQFLDEPARAPDASCIADMPDGQFIVAR